MPTSLVQSTALLRLRTPHVNYPYGFNDGQLMMLGVAAKPEFFNAQPPMPMVFARVFGDATVKWPLQRINPEFKEAIALQAPTLPDRWTSEVKLEGDQLSLKLVRPADNLVEPEMVTLSAVGEFQQQAKMQTIQVPIRWIDPLVVQVQVDGPILSGQSQKLQIQVERSGDDPQPISLRWKNLPAGISAPETVTIPPDQKEVTVDIQAAMDIEFKRFEDLRLIATSQFTGREFTIESKPFALETKQP
jgi:hypothetical protein